MHKHIATQKMKERVRDLARAGTPAYLIAQVTDISEETLNKYYTYQLNCSTTEAVEAIANTVFSQALGGCSKAQALDLKTQGAKHHGWVEKQVVEKTDSKETQELQDKISELEDKYKRDY